MSPSSRYVGIHLRETKKISKGLFGEDDGIVKCLIVALVVLVVLILVKLIF